MFSSALGIRVGLRMGLSFSQVGLGFPVTLHDLGSVLDLLSPSVVVLGAWF